MFSIVQRYRHVSRPWRTPDGAVNHPTLKLMLEAVLAYIVTKPGITENGIYTKYNPILQPVPVTELLQVYIVIDNITTDLPPTPTPLAQINKMVTYL